MEGQSVDQEGWLERLGSVVQGAWGWWTGLSDIPAWQEIGSILLPVLFIVAAFMFWGIRRMHLGD